MIETIKSSGAEAGFFKKWAGYQAAVNKEKIEYGHINIWLGSIPALRVEFYSRKVYLWIC